MKPDVFAAVMATGIVSLAAADHHVDVVSAALAVVAVIALPVLMFLTAARWRSNGWDHRELDTAMGLFTYVAACEVLVGRFEGHRFVVTVLGGLALTGWLSLMPVALRRMWRMRWTGLRDNARGAWELASVATSGLAIVAVAAETLFWGFVLWVLALVLYVLMTALICWRAVHDPAMRRDVPPDHWILMGGLAVATLAGDHVHGHLPPGPIADAVKVVTIVTWVPATLWIVPLACVGWRHVRAWPAVFPLGMYAAATFAVAQETGVGGLTIVSLVSFWIAFVVWILTAIRELSHVGSEQGPVADTPSDQAR